ncbi:MAG: hypothetical protein A2491_03075 [Bacteroidetes bacterium RIFOXYC12_FULL_35_7]|nr:MAG: hypothetical protein A2491_03075 [Bacteroidetes bacterium RIFOXYC12_FULL_35_7]
MKPPVQYLLEVVVVAIGAVPNITERIAVFFLLLPFPATLVLFGIKHTPFQCAALKIEKICVIFFIMS